MLKSSFNFLGATMKFDYEKQHVQRACKYRKCYISSIFFYFHWDFGKKRYFYKKGICIGFFKSSSSARLYLEVLVTIPPLTTVAVKTVAVSYGISPFASFLTLRVLFSYRKKWLSRMLLVLPYMESWFDKSNKCILFELLLYGFT